MGKSIRAKVKYLIRKHNTRNPEIIAKEAGISVEYKPYSNDTKGYFINIMNNKYIVVNENLDENNRRIVLAHELGHAMLHGEENIYFIREHTMFSTGIYETEANKFAAELLIDSKDIEDVMIHESDINRISSALGVTRELVEYKLKK